MRQDHCQLWNAEAECAGLANGEICGWDPGDTCLSLLNGSTILSSKMNVWEEYSRITLLCMYYTYTHTRNHNVPPYNIEP